MLRDGGRRSVIVCGDFNCPPSAWEDSGLLEPLDFSVIIAGNQDTCTTSTGSSLLDYILCDRNVANLIVDLELEACVDWAPHAAVKF